MSPAFARGSVSLNLCPSLTCTPSNIDHLGLIRLSHAPLRTLLIWLPPLTRQQTESQPRGGEVGSDPEGIG